jgi:hypothetical protein
MQVTEYTRPHDIETFYVETECFPEDIPRTFRKLETILGQSMRGRHLYGVTLCLEDKLVFRACVKAEIENEGEQYGLKSYTIPAGKYFATELVGWQENIGQIPALFDQLMRLPEVKKQSICLEDYVDDNNMLAMVQQA